MKRLRMPFSVMLPLLELAVWVVIVLVPVTLTYWNLRQATQKSGTTLIQTGPFGLNISRDEVGTRALMFGTFGVSNTIRGINLPGEFMEILISRLISWPDMWHPRRLLPETWRALSFPFFCLPFWWMVGRGVDALRGGRVLRWPLGLSGAFFSVLFAVVSVGLYVGTTEQDHFDNWLIWGLGVWTLLFGLVGFAWIRHWVRCRRAAKEQQAFTS